MFERARIRLTAWYLGIIMLISLFFSVAIYRGVTNEFERFGHMRIRLHDDLIEREFIPFGTPVPFVREIEPEIFIEAKKRVILNLLFLNSGIFVLAGAAGYFLAGRTLRPIQKVLSEQKRFISDASHELRTPLTSLRSEIEVALRSKTLTQKEARELLESNLEEVASLQSLSNSLLEFSTSAALKNAPKEKIILSKSIDEAIRRLNGSIHKKAIKMNVKVGKISVVGIPERITELFVILLDNAVKYSPSGSQVTVSAKVKKNKTHITVEDNGSGIHAVDLPHIFDRFFRAASSRNVSGHGLGLSIAKEIVLAHDGLIDIKSAKGHGTKVEIIL